MHPFRSEAASSTLTWMLFVLKKIRTALNFTEFTPHPGGLGGRFVSINIDVLGYNKQALLRLNFHEAGRVHLCRVAGNTV